MSPRIRRHKTDDNQAEIVRAVRHMGGLVATTHGVGDGFPDLVVGWRGHILLLEVKDGNKPPSAQKMSLMEVAFHERWRSYAVHVVNSVDDVTKLLFRICPRCGSADTLTSGSTRTCPTCGLQWSNL